jgi:hypothetical protein
MPGLTAFGAAPPAPNPSGTFANLLAGAAPAAPIGMPAMLGNPAGHGWPQPPRGNAALLPAAAVTVPLNDVMRLIAVGAPAPASPFDAFRAAMGASAVR